MYTMSITLQAPHTIHNARNLLRSMYRLLRVYFTRQKKRRKIYSNSWWSFSMHLLVTAFNYWCRSCREEVQDLTYQCLMHLDSSLVYSLGSWEMLTRMSICFHMIYILGKMLCIKMLQVSGGFHQNYELMCPAKKSKFNYQGRCYLQEDTSSLEFLPPTKHEVRRWTFWCTI